jgi:hypothetical protein
VWYGALLVISLSVLICIYVDSTVEMLYGA